MNKIISLYIANYNVISLLNAPVGCFLQRWRCSCLKNATYLQRYRRQQPQSCSLHTHFHLRVCRRNFLNGTKAEYRLVWKHYECSIDLHAGYSGEDEFEKMIHEILICRSSDGLPLASCTDSSPSQQGQHLKVGLYSKRDNSYNIKLSGKLLPFIHEILICRSSQTDGLVPLASCTDSSPSQQGQHL